jgi:hypothetical protein
MTQEQRDIIQQMIAEVSLAEEELTTHLQRHHPQVGRDPQRRAQAEAWVTEREMGPFDAS